MAGIKRNSFFGLVGFAVPTITLFIAYPILIHGLGKDVFGIYVLATSLTGALSILDFGISAATVKFIAQDMGSGDNVAAGDILVSSLYFYGALGMAGMVATWLLAPWLVAFFPFNPTMTVMAIDVFKVAALQMPSALMLPVLIALFKGISRFDYAAAATSFLAVGTYVPAAVGLTFMGMNVINITILSAVSATLVFTVMTAASFALCRQRGLMLQPFPSTRAYRRLFGFGSVMAINSVIAVAVTQLPKYLIGIFIGSGAVSIYTLVFTVSSKAQLLVSSATEVIFPLASGIHDLGRIRTIYHKMLGISLLFGLLIAIPLTLFPEKLLGFWLGGFLASEAADLMQLFAVALLFAAITPPSYHLLNGLGKPHWNTFLLVMHFLMIIVVFGGYTVILGHLELVGVGYAFIAANAVILAGYTVAFHKVFKFHQSSIDVEKAN